VYAGGGSSGHGKPLGNGGSSCLDGADPRFKDDRLGGSSCLESTDP
jgi:hypothetical protein